MSDDRAPLILVVDDNPDGRDLVVEFMRHAGYRTIEAHTGPDALELALTAGPDLVILDLSLPGMDGWEVTERMRADPRTRHTAVIALTAHAQEEPLARAREAGCDLTITKPFMADELLEAIRTLLSDRRSRADQEEPA